MFTGIIEDIGKVVRVEYRAQQRRLTLEFPTHLTDVQLGDSISVNGVCLTIVDKRGQVIDLDLSSESTQKTGLGGLKEGEKVNLERALRPTDRLGGHIVTGHIDGIGSITARNREGDFINLRIRIPKAVSRYVVKKGSVAIDGISLTVNECLDDEIAMTLIPFTIEKTTLIDKKVGDPVNVETDILGKHVEKLLGHQKERSQGVDLTFLKTHGLVREDEE